jgi:TonB family protein
MPALNSVPRHRRTGGRKSRARPARSIAHGKGTGRVGSVPAKPWITASIVREKDPGADLKLQYRKVFSICVAIALFLHVGAAGAFRGLKVGRMMLRREQAVIRIEEIPETRQRRRPPPSPRPAVPIETESKDIPEDVTIASTVLDFDQVPVHIPPAPGSQTDATTPFEEEEIGFAGEPVFSIHMVEKKPELVRYIKPRYPRDAKSAGIEGLLHVEFTVSKKGRAKDAVLREGPPIFWEEALNALQMFQFRPALQNREPVEVRMSILFRFQLDQK